MYELLALKFWKFPGRQCLMDSFFFSSIYQVRLLIEKSQKYQILLLYLICWVLLELNQIGSGIEKSRVSMVSLGTGGWWIWRGIFCSWICCLFVPASMVFSQMCVFLSCHRCPRWLRRVWDMSGIPFTRSLAVRHRSSVTLWRPL